MAQFYLVRKGGQYRRQNPDDINTLNQPDRSFKIGPFKDWRAAEAHIHTLPNPHQWRLQAAFPNMNWREKSVDKDS